MYGRCMVVMAASFLACACQRKSGGASDETIATIGEHLITAADLRARAAEQSSLGQSRYRSLDRKKDLLEGMITSDLLAQEARRRGLDNDPEVRSTIERVLVQKLTRVHAEEAEKVNPTPEAELRRYYEQHKPEFVTPTRVRIAHLYLAAPEKDTRRGRALSEARRLLADVKARAARGEKQPLELLASQRSEDAQTKATGGDLGYRLRKELAQTWGPALADAAFALHTQGDFGDIVATEKGIHLLKMLGRQQGYETSFEAAKSRIADRLKLDRRAHDIDDLVAELRKKAKIHIDEKALARIDPEAAPTTAAR